MSEMLIMKPGEAISHAARKGMTVLASADDQPSFREHLHPVVDKAVSLGPPRQEALILSERGDGPKAGARTPLARMTFPPAFGAVTLLRSEHDPTGFLDAAFQEPPALPVRLSEPDRFHNPRNGGAVDDTVEMGGVDNPDFEAEPYASHREDTASWHAGRLPEGEVFDGEPASAHVPEQGHLRIDAELTGTQPVRHVAQDAASGMAHLLQPDLPARQTDAPETFVPTVQVPARDADRPEAPRIGNPPLVMLADDARKEVLIDRKPDLSARHGAHLHVASGGADQNGPSPPPARSSAIATPGAELSIDDLKTHVRSQVLFEAKVSAPLVADHLGRSVLPIKNRVPLEQMTTTGPMPNIAPLAAHMSPPDLRQNNILASGFTRGGAEDLVSASIIPFATVDGGYSKTRLPIGQHLAPTIWAQVSGAIAHSTTKSFQIQLAPLELGRVRVTMNATDAGVQVIIFAERPETLELMRKFSADFERDLKDLGYDRLDMNFSHQQTADHQFQKRLHADEPDQQPEPALPAESLVGPVNVSVWTGMDIRV
ncbi:MAG: flagellar hook-length control protein FliK [Roseinatronobacter sp.]|nr:MAG: flagellar hook-length control protein FliK [Roseinatronobacter sp.]